MNVLPPPDEDFPPGCRAAIARALPIYRNYETYDHAKRLMDAALVIRELRLAGFKLVGPHSGITLKDE